MRIDGPNLIAQSVAMRPVLEVMRRLRFGSCLGVGDGGGREPSCEEETQHPETGRDRPC